MIAPSAHDRRAFLGAMVGSVAAASACRRPYAEVPGTIRDDGVRLGHQLGRVPRVTELGAPTRTEDVPVVIVGAGPSGLAAAWRLQRLGETRCVVLDLERQPGGTSHYATDGVVPYPWGAHYVPTPRAENRAFVQLLDEMGALEGRDALTGQPLPREELLVRDPEERLFHEGQWHPGLFPKAGASPGDLAEWAAFQRNIDELVAWRDGRGRRAFTLPLEHGSDDPDVRVLDRISMAQWMDQKGFRSARLRWWVEYACRDDYGLRLPETSAWAALFYFASRLAHPGAEGASLIAWPEGNGHLVRHLATVAGERIRTQTLVVDVASFEDHADVLAWEAARHTTVRYRAERVIFAAPKFLAPHLVRTVRDERLAWPQSFTYGAWLVANIHLREHPRSSGTPLAWDNVLYGSPSLGYVVATHQAQRDAGPTILTYYYPYTDSDPRRGRQRLLAATHGELADGVLADLRPAHHGLDRLIERLDIWRWGHAMVQPRVGFIWGADRAIAAQALGRVHWAHSDLSGLALFEESLHHGVRAAEEVFAALHPEQAATMTRLA